MDKKRGYNIKYLLLFTSAAALLCALAAYISINDTYKYTRERAAFLAESYGSQTRYELMDLYDDAFVLRELIQQGMLDAKGTKIAVHEKGFRNMSELGIQRMNNVCTAFDDMALITNVSLAMAEGPLQDGIPEKTVISYCFPYEINKSALGKNLMVQPKRDDAIRKVYRKQGELVIEGPFRRIQDNELVLTGRVAVKNSDGSPWGLVAVTLDMNPASPKYALQNINFAALQGQKYRYHLYKIENGAKLTIAASDHAAMAMTGGMKYDIELPNASCIIEVDKAGGWVGNNIIFLNAGIAFFVWLLSVFAVKKWLENKEAHREIADREEILRQIADNINGGVLTLVNDAGFCIRYANDGFLKLIGYTREELENVPSFLRAHLIYEEDAPKFQALLDGVWHLNDKIDLEMRLLHKNGHYIPVLIRGSVGIDKDGMLVMYCVIVDISEQKRIIQELELEKERYDLLVQASNEIIFDVDVLPEHIAWSPLYHRIFGFEPFGKLASESAPPLKSEPDKNIAVISAFIHKIIAEKHSDSEELLLSYANGEQHWFRIRANCIIKKETVIRLVGKLDNIDAEMLEKEGAEVILPDFMGFVKFMATHKITFNSLLNINKTSAKISKIAIKLIDILEKDEKIALANSKKGYLQPCDIWHLEDKVKDVLSIGNQTGEGWFLTAEMIEYMEHDIPNIICVQPFACLPNHVVGKGVIKTIREKYPEANISPVDYDPGSSETNQANRIKLLMTVAKDNLQRQENEKKALDNENKNVKENIETSENF